ncbi:MAG: purine-nucleoside phosphorylase [Deltaproteobacteria bacterium]|nr:purine-nucleoside phosphorylase [Deltaproteobacteria bacterium]
MTYHNQVSEAADFLRKKINVTPRVGIMTGTGLGNSAESLDATAVFDYAQIPHFPDATVESHMGRLSFGSLVGKPVMALQGRFHLYEGYTPREVAFPIRVMQQLGVKTLILSNAAGGLNPNFIPGDIMVIRDHINLTGKNPLTGPNHDPWGDRFPDMSSVYDLQLATLAESAGVDGPLKSGIYAGLPGPSLETPAEVRYLRTIGADAVGFSTVTESIVAVHAGMSLLGLSIITNVHNPDNPQPASVSEIIELAGRVAPRVNEIIQAVISQIDD